jgi:hypothetical protein
MVTCGVRAARHPENPHDTPLVWPSLPPPWQLAAHSILERKRHASPTARTRHPRPRPPVRPGPRDPRRGGAAGRAAATPWGALHVRDVVAGRHFRVQRVPADARAGPGVGHCTLRFPGGAGKSCLSQRAHDTSGRGDHSGGVEQTRPRSYRVHGRRAWR